MGVVSSVGAQRIIKCFNVYENNVNHNIKIGLRRHLASL